jgi:hypothetical protein
MVTTSVAQRWKRRGLRSPRRPFDSRKRAQLLDDLDGFLYVMVCSVNVIQGALLKALRK